MTSIVSCKIQWTTRNLNAHCSFGLFLKSCFLSVIVCVCFGVCVLVCVCVDGFKMDVLVRVHVVSLHFPPFYFSFFFFLRFVLVIFLPFS